MAVDLHLQRFDDGQVKPGMAGRSGAGWPPPSRSDKRGAVPWRSSSIVMVHHEHSPAQTPATSAISVAAPALGSGGRWPARRWSLSDWRRQRIPNRRSRPTVRCGPSCSRGRWPRCSAWRLFGECQRVGNFRLARRFLFMSSPEPFPFPSKSPPETPPPSGPAEAPPAPDREPSPIPPPMQDPALEPTPVELPPMPGDSGLPGPTPMEV